MPLRRFEHVVAHSLFESPSLLIIYTDKGLASLTFWGHSPCKWQCMLFNTLQSSSMFIVVILFFFVILQFRWLMSSIDTMFKHSVVICSDSFYFACAFSFRTRFLARCTWCALRKNSLFAKGIFQITSHTPILKKYMWLESSFHVLVRAMWREMRAVNMARQ